MFDKHIHNSTQYIPYCKEVNHTYNMPTTTEQIAKVNEMREDLKKDLLDVFVVEIEPFKFEALISCWKSLDKIGVNETRITIMNSGKAYHKIFSSPCVSDNYSFFRYTEDVKQRVKELLDEIVQYEFMKISRSVIKNG